MLVNTNGWLRYYCSVGMRLLVDIVNMPQELSVWNITLRNYRSGILVGNIAWQISLGISVQEEREDSRKTFLRDYAQVKRIGWINSVEALLIRGDIEKK